MIRFLNWSVVIVRVNVYRCVLYAGLERRCPGREWERAASARLDSLYLKGLDIHVMSGGTV